MPESQEIVNDTSGIIFLGTPHLGSSMSIVAVVLASVTGFLGSDTTLLMSLKSHGAQLSNLRRSFDKVVAKNEQHQKITIISFYETMATYFLGWLYAGVVGVRIFGSAAN